MYSLTAQFSFSKCVSADLLGNTFTTVSDIKLMDRVNADAGANNRGIGLAEGYVEASLNPGEWIVVFLNGYDKSITHSNKDWYVQLKYTE